MERTVTNEKRKYMILGIAVFFLLAFRSISVQAVTFERIPNACDYINEQEEQLAEGIDFTLEWCEAYTMDSNELLRYFQMQGGFVIGTIQVTKHEDKTVDVHLEPYYYPGVRVAYAYRSGDTSFLTSEERSLYDYCMDIANDAYLVSNTDLEREKYIHDFICDRVVYKTDGTKDSTMPVPRHKTAIGAFFDGEANCQGYTDLFYVLATMAGFEVRKQIGGNWSWTGPSDNNHIWNVIKLDGKWYEVDVTWDDQEHSDAPYIYASFNFAPGWSYGHDLGNFGVCADMGWSSDQKYFYYSELGVCASDYATLAQKVYDYKCNHPNESQVHAMYIGGQLDTAAFDNAMKDYANQFSRWVNWSYRVYTIQFDNPEQWNSFLVVTWNQFG